MGTTPTYALPYPELTDQANVPTDMRELAERIEVVFPVPVDSGWKALTITGGGFTLPGSSVVWGARQIGNRVQLRGRMANATFTGGYTAVATLPAGIGPPSTTMAFPIGGNSAVMRSFVIDTVGVVSLYAVSATSAFYDLGATTYLTN